MLQRQGDVDAGVLSVGVLHDTALRTNKGWEHQSWMADLEDGLDGE
jgi:hypothetical protein